MMGHVRDYGKRSTGFGWLNPYQTRTPDGDTQYDAYIKMSDTTVNEIIKKIEVEFYEWPGLL